MKKLLCILIFTIILTVPFFLKGATIVFFGGTDDGTAATVSTGATDNEKVPTQGYVDDAIPVKATGAELTTGTDDAKFATAKAIKDSHNVPSVAPSTDGNVLTSNGTDWVSEAAAGGVTAVYAEMYGINQTTSVSVITTWYEINGLSSGVFSGCTIANSDITVGSTGLYLIVISGIGNDAIDNTEIPQYGVSVNDSMQAKSYSRAGSGDNECIALSAILSLSANDVLKLEVENLSGTHDMYIRFVNMSVTKL